MLSYNATIELHAKHADADQLIDALDGYHPAIGTSDLGRVEIIITLPAETLRQAVTTALAVVGAATKHAVLSIAVLPTADFDARLGLETMPELVSVTEAAQELGVSRQAVLQRLESGSLPGRKVGTTWVLPAMAVAATLEAIARTEGVLAAIDGTQRTLDAIGKTATHLAASDELRSEIDETLDKL